MQFSSLNGMEAPYAARCGLAILASLRLTLAAIVLLGAGAWIVAERPDESAFSAELIVPLTLLSLNLVAAILTNRAFRRQPALLVFHLSLLALVLLSLASRLTYLEGTAELAVGQSFSGLAERKQGILHRGRLDEVEFVNQGFSVNYRPQLRRDKTINHVVWRDDLGFERRMEIGDQTPLVLHGYRFYTTSNKGFAALFRWEPAKGDPQLGSVHLPSYPLYAKQQKSAWRLGIDDIQVGLNIDEQLIDPSKDDEFRMPQRHTVTLDLAWRVATLSPGEELLLPSGRLVYVGLSTWMGYAVTYDWTVPWLLAACALAVLALGWHFWSKFASRPWQPG
jgi:cytochrome c biogenesis protein